MKKIVFVLLLILCFYSNTFSQTKSAEKLNINELDSFVNKVLEEWQAPGLALAIVKDGKVFFEKGYGVKNINSKEKVTTATLFSIASATKSFTSTVAAMLVEEKKMGWDVPLINYFPDFKMYDKTATGKITIKDLLSHRSGIPREKFYSLMAPEKRINTRYDMQYFEQGTDFRSSFLYCNETFAVAGDMIAERGGTTWEDLIQKRIFDPLGMANSIFSIKNLAGKDFATPHIEWSGKTETMTFHNADMLGGAGCIISNVEDLSKWVLFNLNKGKVNENQLLSSKSLIQIQAPVIYVPGSSKYKEVINQCYGMGWFSDAYRGYKRIHHGGVLYGFTSLVSFLPNENIGIVVLSNMNGTPLTTIIEGYVYDRLLGIEPIDWNQRNVDSDKKIRAYYEQMESVKDTSFKPDSKTSLPLDFFCGKYVSDGYGALTIRKEGDSLMTSMLGIVCPLRHYNNDIFELYHPIEHESFQLTFITGADKKANALQIEILPGLNPIIYKKEI